MSVQGYDDPTDLITAGQVAAQNPEELLEREGGQESGEFHTSSDDGYPEIYCLSHIHTPESNRTDQKFRDKYDNSHQFFYEDLARALKQNEEDIAVLVNQTDHNIVKDLEDPIEGVEGNKYASPFNQLGEVMDSVTQLSPFMYKAEADGAEIYVTNGIEASIEYEGDTIHCPFMGLPTDFKFEEADIGEKDILDLVYEAELTTNAHPGQGKFDSSEEQRNWFFELVSARGVDLGLGKAVGYPSPSFANVNRWAQELDNGNNLVEEADRLRREISEEIHLLPENDYHCGTRPRAGGVIKLGNEAYDTLEKGELPVEEIANGDVVNEASKSDLEETVAMLQQKSDLAVMNGFDMAGINLSREMSQRFVKPFNMAFRGLGHLPGVPEGLFAQKPEEFRELSRNNLESVFGEDGYLVK